MATEDETAEVQEEAATGKQSAAGSTVRRARRRGPAVTDPASPDARRLLAEGEFVGAQAMPDGSNYTFAVALADADGVDCLAIYKPQRGEVPLWDFPSGTLYRREFAAYVVSEALGWNIVPPTIIREGPAGIGSLQFYVPPSRKAAQQYSLPMRLRPALCRLTLFDHLTNNADRKRSHLHIDTRGRLWAIDHGLTFNSEWKLRTVVFEFVGEAIPDDLLADVEMLRADESRYAALRASLAVLLDEEEVEAFFARIEELLVARTFPVLDPEVNVPRGW
jgi:hypothetical protein